MEASEYSRWQALCEKLRTREYASLTQPEKVWVNIRCLIDSITNGGLISYYYNSYADRLDECMAALDVLGADEVRRQMERVNALFPDGVPPDDTRNAVIDSWDDGDGRIDALLEDVDDRLMPLLDDLEERLRRFLRREGLLT